MELIVVPLLTAVGATGAASAATAIGTSGLFSALGALGTVAGGVSSMMAGQQQSAMYGMQAAQAQMQSQQALAQAKANELKYKSAEVQYIQQGVNVLNRTLSTVATITARAGAGSIDPFSGSAGQLSNLAFGKGFGEFNFAREGAAMAREGQEIALASGQANAAAFNMQAGIYDMMGQQAEMAGYVKGATSIFGGLYSASQIGGPSLLGPSNLSQYPAANVPLPPVRPFGV